MKTEVARKFYDLVRQVILKDLDEETVFGPTGIQFESLLDDAEACEQDVAGITPEERAECADNEEFVCEADLLWTHSRMVDVLEYAYEHMDELKSKIETIQRLIDAVINNDDLGEDGDRLQQEQADAAVQAQAEATAQEYVNRGE